MSLDKNVHVYADEPVTVMWDGKEYELGENPTEVKRGVAEHWAQSNDIRIEEVPDELIEQRKPENPLEENNRGTAFADLTAKPGDEEVAALRAKGKELGIKNAHNMKVENLKAAIAEAEKGASDQ